MMIPAGNKQLIQMFFMLQIVVVLLTIATLYQSYRKERIAYKESQ